MLERWLLPKEHAIVLLLEDHDRVKQLFDQFNNAKSSREKERIIADATTELKIHASLEEEIFYPTVRQHVGKDLMDEADEEHHVARVLVAELDNRRDRDHRYAKFTVLAENIRHHIREEEGEVLPKAKELDIDFVALGHRMLARKQELERDGVPPDAEHAMVVSARGEDDTPAAASRRDRAESSPRRVRSARRSSAAPKRRLRKR